MVSCSSFFSAARSQPLLLFATLLLALRAPERLVATNSDPGAPPLAHCSTISSRAEQEGAVTEWPQDNRRKRLANLALLFAMGLCLCFIFALLLCIAIMWFGRIIPFFN